MAAGKVRPQFGVMKFIETFGNLPQQSRLPHLANPSNDNDSLVLQVCSKINSSLKPQ